MKLKPIPETKANDKVKRIYLEIKTALELPQVPLFFQFLGAFPDYLNFIKNPIVNNLNSSKYDALVYNNQHFVEEIFQENFPKKELTQEFLSKYQKTAEFYNLKPQLQHIFTVNAKLVFIFLALREAVKGWAVASKKLESHFANRKETEVETSFISKELKTKFVYSTDIISQNSQLARLEKNLSTKTTSGLEVALLPQYLSLCEAEFNQLIKTQAYLFFRVELEKICLNSLEQLPFPIFSPVNLVYELAQKYPDFPDLLYLLSEHFPTYVISRYLFSSYMLY